MEKEINESLCSLVARETSFKLGADKGNEILSNMPVGTVVWIRLTGFPEWPGRIAAESEVGPRVLNLKHTSQHILVYFFGSHDYTWIKPSQISTFDEGFAKKSKKCKNKVFSYGVKEAMDWKTLSPEEQQRMFPDFKKTQEEYNLHSNETPAMNTIKTEIGSPLKKTDKVRCEYKGNPTAIHDETKSECEQYRWKHETTFFNGEEKTIKEIRRRWKIKIMRRLALYPPSENDEENEDEWYKKKRKRNVQRGEVMKEKEGKKYKDKHREIHETIGNGKTSEEHMECKTKTKRKKTDSLLSHCDKTEENENKRNSCMQTSAVQTETLEKMKVESM